MKRYSSILVLAFAAMLVAVPVMADEQKAESAPAAASTMEAPKAEAAPAAPAEAPKAEAAPAAPAEAPAAAPADAPAPAK
jgi:hypothetical protein